MATLCVSAEQCKSWEKSGKQEFIKLCRSCVAKEDGTESLEKKNLRRAIYEISWHGVKGTLKLENVVLTFSELMDLSPDATSLITDVLSIMDVEIITNDDKDQREKFMTLLSNCAPAIPEVLLKERLDPETLENMGILTSKTGFSNKYVKVKTRLFYKQQKFNLLREESEGYSKLITELNQDLGGGTTAADILECVKSLIGCFNLDPNRVLDIILESFECRPDCSDFFVHLLKEYMCDRDTLCHVLGFKFQFYQDTQESQTPSSLYHVAALLLYYDLLSLDSLCAHLSPSNADIQQLHTKQFAEAKEYTRKLTVVNLGDKQNNDAKDKDEAKPDPFANNQKLGMCEALLLIGDWTHAKLLMTKLPPFMAASHPPVALALCKVINAVIEPLYAQHNGLPAVLQRRRTKCTLPNNLGLTPVATFEDLCQEAFPMMRCLGPNVALDTILMVKILRLAKAFMKKRDEGVTPETEEIFRGVLTIVDEVLLPGLSMLPCNCCMAEEIWSFLKLLKYEYRYRLYGQWKNEVHTHHPKMIKVRADVADRSRYIMKRLSKENVKPLGRQIGKLSHSNPGVIFESILSQIQRFDNLIGPVVDSLKYLTSLSYDVLAYCIIEALANPERERMKHDDTNISLWLQSLATFCGTVLKKYQIDLAGLLQYVCNQLKADKSYDLLILREVVQRMAGVEITEEMTADQIDAMSGGELLKQEGGYFAQVRNTKKSSNRLKDSLIENRLAIPLCVLMAQERHGIVFTRVDHFDDKRHLKLVGKLYDQCQDTFVQFASFLSTQLAGDELNRLLPTIDTLLATYNIGPDAAFALWRGLLSSSINAKYDELRKADKKEREKQDKQVTTQSAKVQRYVDASKHVMRPVMEVIASLNPSSVWDGLSLQFYTTFWSLSMYDLQVPAASYEKQVQQLKTQLVAIDDMDLTSSKKRKERERCNNLIEKLEEEEKKQQDHVKMVMARLKHEKDTWFISKVQKQAIITSLLQMCLFPRSCFTAVDAFFCAKMLYIMHSLKTPNFSSLICYDRIFSNVLWAMTSCSENEAHRFGRFLCAIFEDVMRWHGDRTSYDKECSGYPGFVTVFRALASKPGPGQVPADQLDYENYRHVVNKWHFTFTRATVHCLESGDFIQIRNALIVLTKILPCYPKVLRLGMAIERRIDKLCQDEKEKRPDLYTFALAYAGQLKAKKKAWVPEHEFHKKDIVSEVQQGKLKKSRTISTKESAAPTEKKGTNGKAAAPAAGSQQEAGSDTTKVKSDKMSNNKDSSSRSKKSVEAKNGEDSSKKKERSAATDDSAVSLPAADPHGSTSNSKDKRESKVRTKEKKERESKDKDRAPAASASVVEKSDKHEKRHRESKEREKKDERSPRVERREKEEKKSHREAKESRESKVRHKEPAEEVRMEEEPEKRSREKDRSGRERKEHRGHSRDREHDHDKRASSVTSSGSGSAMVGSRRSVESSPKLVDERDTKRRKVESVGSSKDKLSHDHSSHRNSPSSHDMPRPHKSPRDGRGSSRASERDREQERSQDVERERTTERHDHKDSDFDQSEWEWEREKERRAKDGERRESKGDRKRERSTEREVIDTKRHKTQDHSSKAGKTNGDSQTREKSRDRREKQDERVIPRSKVKEDDGATNHISASSSRKSRKSSPDKEKRLSDKHKKSKHH